MRKIIVFTSTPDSNHSCQMMKAADSKTELWCCDGKSSEQLRYYRIWSRSALGYIKLICLLRSIKDLKVNIQHEFNVFPGITGAFFFLAMLIFLTRPTVSLHAFVSVSRVNAQFMRIFNIKFSSAILNFFFYTFFYIVVRFAGKVIVHTTLQLEELCKQYPLYKNKYQYLQIGVGPALPPGDNLSLDLEEKFDFLLFGYICARKNIIQVIDNISKLNKIRGKNYSLCLAGKVRAEDKNFFEMTCKYILESGINCTIKTEILDEDIDSLFIKSKCVLFPYRIAVGASGPFCYALYHGNFIVAPFFGTFIDYQSSKLKHYKNDLEFTDVMSSICDKLDNKFIDDPGNDEVHQPTWTDYVIKTFT